MTVCGAVCCAAMAATSTCLCSCCRQQLSTDYYRQQYVKLRVLLRVLTDPAVRKLPVRPALSSQSATPLDFVLKYTLFDHVILPHEYALRRAHTLESELYLGIMNQFQKRIHSRPQVPELSCRLLALEKAKRTQSSRGDILETIYRE